MQIAAVGAMNQEFTTRFFSKSFSLLFLLSLAPFASAVLLDYDPGGTPPSIESISINRNASPFPISNPDWLTDDDLSSGENLGRFFVFDFSVELNTPGPTFWSLDRFELILSTEIEETFSAPTFTYEDFNGLDQTIGLIETFVGGATPTLTLAADISGSGPILNPNAILQITNIDFSAAEPETTVTEVIIEISEAENPFLVPDSGSSALLLLAALAGVAGLRRFRH